MGKKGRAAASLDRNISLHALAACSSSRFPWQAAQRTAKRESSVKRQNSRMSWKPVKSGRFWFCPAPTPITFTLGPGPTSVSPCRPETERSDIWSITFDWLTFEKILKSKSKNKESLNAIKIIMIWYGSNHKNHWLFSFTV